jgi:hypothetical protein
VPMLGKETGENKPSRQKLENGKETLKIPIL